MLEGVENQSRFTVGRTVSILGKKKGTNVWVPKRLPEEQYPGKLMLAMR